jgi:hypothetical protein
MSPGDPSRSSWDKGNGARTCPERSEGSPSHRYAIRPPIWGSLYQVAGLGFPGPARQGRRTQDLQVISFAPETAIAECQVKRLGLPFDLRFLLTRRNVELVYSGS